MSTATKNRPAKGAKEKKQLLPAENVAVAHAPTQTEWIRIAEIERDGQNHRLEGPENKRRIRELADSFAAGPDAQLEPIRVYDRDGKPYLLGFGFRRCAAAELAGWVEIRAEILPMPTDRSEIERDRARENLQRQDLNPMEEAMAVAQYLEALPSHQFYRDGGRVAPRDEEGEGPLLPTRDSEGKPQKWAIEHVAAQLGRTPAWVRDRCYLLRLGPKVRKVLIAGKLLLGHAREISKLGDYAAQERLVEMCQVRDDGTCHTTLEQLRRYVGEHQRSLKVVPWRLEADFDGMKDKRILGACATCPHNSTNDRQLFEHDQEPAQDGYCLHDACFEAKQAACNKAVEKAVATIVKKELPATENTALHVAAEYVKPARVVREAKKAKADPPAAPKDEGVEDAGASRAAAEALTPEQQAEADLETATEKWIQESTDAVREAAVKNPWHLACLLLLDWAVATWQLTNDDVLGRHARMFEALARGDQEGVRELAEVISADENLELNVIGDLPEAAIDLLVIGWKLPVVNRPTLADFLPKPKPEVKRVSGKTRAQMNAILRQNGPAELERKRALHSPMTPSDAPSFTIIDAILDRMFGPMEAKPAPPPPPSPLASVTALSKPQTPMPEMAEMAEEYDPSDPPAHVRAVHDAQEEEADRTNGWDSVHPQASALVWHRDGNEWWAENTAGMESDPDVIACFQVSPAAGAVIEWVIDMSDDDLLPVNFPKSFESEQKAKVFCENRNAELVAKGREQMPEVKWRTESPVGFAEEPPIQDPKDIDLSERELFAADQLDALARMGEKPKRVKHVLPLLGVGFLGLEVPGRHPCVVLGTSVVRGQECLRLGLLVRVEDWPKDRPAPAAGKVGRDRVIAGDYAGILVIACNTQHVIGDVFHVRVGKGGRS